MLSCVFENGFLLGALMRLVPLWLSLSVHEWAHAYAAFRLGDDTAALEGRMTLNPFVHVDPFGTFLFPLVGIPFGWARPVPINPTRFRRDVTMGTGVMLSAAAGPASNLVLALVCAIVTGLLSRAHLLDRHAGARQLLFILLQTNVLLFLFNLLPIPPLDGSRIVEGLVPYRYRRSWDRLNHLSTLESAVLLVISAIVLFPSSLFVEVSLQQFIYLLSQ